MFHLPSCFRRRVGTTVHVRPPTRYTVRAPQPVSDQRVALVMLRLVVNELNGWPVGDTSRRRTLTTEHPARIAQAAEFLSAEVVAAGHDAVTARLRPVAVRLAQTIATWDYFVESPIYSRDESAQWSRITDPSEHLSLLVVRRRHYDLVADEFGDEYSFRFAGGNRVEEAFRLASFGVSPR